MAKTQQQPNQLLTEPWPEEVTAAAAASSPMVIKGKTDETAIATVELYNA